MEQAIDTEVAARSRNMSYANVAHIEAQPVSEVPGDTEEVEGGTGSTGVSSGSVRNACTHCLCGSSQN